MEDSPTYDTILRESTVPGMSDDMLTSVRLDVETEHELEEIVESLERSKGWIIRQAICTVQMRLPMMKSF
jgi:hypothetical protein